MTTPSTCKVIILLLGRLDARITPTTLSNLRLSIQRLILLLLEMVALLQFKIMIQVLTNLNVLAIAD